MAKLLERKQDPDRCPTCGTPIAGNWCSYCPRSITEAELALSRLSIKKRGTESFEPFPDVLSDGAGVTVTILEQIESRGNPAP